jgi:glutaredoxin
MSNLSVYWQPGCTSCLKTREFLAMHGVEFDSIDVAANPEAMEALAKLGVRSVPVVVRGTEFVFGQDLDAVARFVDVVRQRDALLPVATLAQRLHDLCLQCARLARHLPESSLATRLPGRDRSYLDLAYHVPMIVAGFLDAANGGCLTEEHFNRKPPPRIRGTADVAQVIERLARAFDDWWRANERALPGHVDTYYGHQPFHSVLERTTWHVAQHARQLERVVELAGVKLDSPLDPNLLAGLPLPRDVWDAEVPL